MAFGGHMRDRCKIGTAGSSTGPSPVQTYTYGNETRCRYVRKSSRDVGAGKNVQKSNVQIRLPGGTTVTGDNRIELTKLNRTVQNPSLFFAIVGEPWETQGQLVCDCELLDGNAIT